MWTFCSNDDEACSQGGKSPDGTSTVKGDSSLAVTQNAFSGLYLPL